MNFDSVKPDCLFLPYLSQSTFWLFSFYEHDSWLPSTCSTHRSVCCWITASIVCVDQTVYLSGYCDLQISTLHVVSVGPVELASAGVSMSIFNIISKLFNIPLLSVATSFVAEDIAKSASRISTSGSVLVFGIMACHSHV